MHISGFLHKTSLTFVKQQLEHDDIHSFFFTPDKPISHLAGQHGLFTLPRLGLIKGTHVFSLASAPEEDMIRISTHLRAESAYKQALMSLKAGDKIAFRGPVLDFVYRQNANNCIFLAQGIGITPFRSMLMHARLAKLDVHTTLLHVARGEHTFKAETEQLAGIAVYPASAEDFTVEIKKHLNIAATYYISGSPTFVKATKQTLRSLNVPRSNIVTDNFIGYS